MSISCRGWSESSNLPVAHFFPYSARFLSILSRVKILFSSRLRIAPCSGFGDRNSPAVTGRDYHPTLRVDTAGSAGPRLGREHDVSLESPHWLFYYPTTFYSLSFMWLDPAFVFTFLFNNNHSLVTRCDLNVSFPIFRDVMWQEHKHSLPINGDSTFFRWRRT